MKWTIIGYRYNNVRFRFTTRLSKNQEGELNAYFDSEAKKEWVVF